MSINLGRIESLLRTPRGLGAYLLALACAQMCLYLAWTEERSEWLIYIDPRGGTSGLESLLRDTELIMPGTLSWGSAFVLLGVAAFLVATNHGLRLYLVIEALLAAPTVIAFAGNVIIRMLPTYGLAIAELQIPASIFLIFTVVPINLALRIIAGSPQDLSILPPSTAIAVTEPGEATANLGAR